jgi:hypothetical protein
VHGHAYFSEATDETALFTFAEANRALSSGPPRRVKVSSLAVRSLDDFLAQTSKAEQIAAFRAEHGVTSNDQLLEVILRFAPMAK